MLTRKRAAVFVASLATIAIVPACNDQGTTAPQLRPPAAAHDGAALYQAFLGVAATNDVNNGTFGPVSSGISIPARARFIVRVTGSLGVSLKPDMPCTPPADLGPWTYGPRTYDREMGIQITRTAGPSFVDLYYFNGDTTVLQSDTLYTPVPLGLDLWRQGIVGGCGVGGGLYQMSGVQTITVEVVEVVPPNGMLLSPNPAPRMDQGDSLVFTASAKYTNTGENLWMLPPSGFPYAWSFLPDSSAATPNPIRQTIPGCWTDRTCKLKATTSGTLTAYGSFSPDGAATDSVSVHVDVTPCPWKDPIIDSPEVRRQLVKEFQLSATTQLERAGGIYRDSTGRDTVIYSVVPGTATQCRNSAGVGVPGLELIAIWHTHPLAPGQPFTNCPTALPGRVAAQGPSRPYDYDAQKQVGVPEYIIDPRTVFRVTSNPGRRWWQSPQALTSKPWKSCPNWAS